MITNKEQFGFQGLTVKGITVHNTGSFLTAKECYEAMETAKNSRGTHYFVDCNEVIQAMPLDWCVYHTGMGVDWACKHTIAIEICQSLNDYETYMQAQNRAVELMKQLMEQYGLTTKNIYFHHDFRANTYCPHRILDMYGTKANWIKEVFG